MKERLKTIKEIIKKGYYKKEMILIFLVSMSLLGFVIYESLAIFAGTVEKSNVATIVAGNITFTVTSDDSAYNASTGQITVAANSEKFITLTVTNTTVVGARYRVYYKPINPSTLPSGVTVGVSSLSPYAVTETLTQKGAIASSKKIRVGIKNTSTSSVTIKLGVEGGYQNNTVTLSSGNTAVSTTINEGMTSVSYDYTGSYQTFTAPAAGKYLLEVWGAQGGGKSFSGNTNSGDGGKGGYSKGTITLSKGQKLYIYVGGHGESSSTGLASGGWNGGGSAWATSTSEPANGGGGATDIRYGAYTDPLNSTSLNQRIIVAGGGGGGGEDSGETGGAGGGTTGVAGDSSNVNTYPGTQSSSSGGGAFGKGAHTPNDGGAGGGGWYGGGTTTGSQTIPTANSGSDTSRSASGGSGYVLTSSSTRPSGYSPSSSYYLTKAQTIAGNTSFASPTGEEETGHSGNGYAKISLLPNEPTLPSGMIPVVYDATSGNWEVADTSTEWYDYYNQKWANAVTTSNSTYRTAAAGTEIPMSSINSMWVWIPRYKYKIPSNIGSSSYLTSPPEIDVVFEYSTNTTGSTLSSCPIDSSTCYYTHPAFRNGEEVYTTTAYDQGGWSKELSGIWVGKFETGGSATTPLIKPDIQSLRSQNVSTQFQTALKFAGGTMNTSTGTVTFAGNSTYGLTSTTDTHMAKNTEWGAVAYLSQSKYGKYGNENYTGSQKEIYINNSESYYTGRSGGNKGGSTPINGTYTNQTSTTQYIGYGFYTYDDYLLSYGTNTKSSKVAGKGVGASTTGTIYGIYDMSGGAYEYTMSNWNGYSGHDSSNNSGFTGTNGDGTTTSGISFPSSKYYDKYTKGTSSNTITKEKAIKGDATYETMRWYSDSPLFVHAGYPWAIRGGVYSYTSDAGVFDSSNSYGHARSTGSVRSVLIP